MLNKVQIAKITKAKINGTGTNFRLNANQMDLKDQFNLTKAQINKIVKSEKLNKGLNVVLNDKQVKAISNDILNIIPDVKEVGSLIKNIGKVSKSVIKGGAIDPMTAMAVMGVVKELIPIFAPLIAPLLADLQYIIENPAAFRFKNIFVNRIPNLNFRYNTIGNTINFLNSKKKPNQQRIARLHKRRADIVSLIEMLIIQLPRLKEVAEAKDEVLMNREESKLDKQLTAALSKLESVQSKKDELEEEQNERESKKGNGLQIDRGNGLQVDPPSRGSGLVIRGACSSCGCSCHMKGKGKVKTSDFFF